MNFLELCQRVVQEADTGSQGPVSTAGQRGEALYVVNAVVRSWRDIQQIRPDWSFRRSELSLPLVAGTHTYAPEAATDTNASALVSRFSDWYLDTVRIDDIISPLIFEPWDQFRYIRTIGTSSSATGRPIIFTILPDKRSLRFWSIPDAAYTITASYVKSPQVLASDSDVPEIEDEFHEVIVWRALQFLGRRIAAPEIISDAKDRERQMMARLRERYLDPMIISRTVA